MWVLLLLLRFERKKIPGVAPERAFLVQRHSQFGLGQNFPLGACLTAVRVLKLVQSQKPVEIYQEFLIRVKIFLQQSEFAILI